MGKKFIFGDKYRKSPDITKLKYRLHILGAYLLFILLCLLIVQIKGTTNPYIDKNSEVTTADLQGNNNDIKEGNVFKKGDVVKLIISFPSEYNGKEIELVYLDYTSGESTIVYEGRVKEKLNQTFIINEDGKADFMILTDSDKNNITDLVDVNYVIEQSTEREENITPVN